MQLQELLEETLNTASLECWAEESTPTPVRASGATPFGGVVAAGDGGCVGAVRRFPLASGGLPVGPPPRRPPSRPAAECSAAGRCRRNRGADRLRVVLAVRRDRSGLEALVRRAAVAAAGETPVAAFLSELKERHDLSAAELLVDGFGSLTALARTDLSGQLEYTERDKIEKWFQTLKMRVERFHNTWNGGLASAARWLCRPSTCCGNGQPAL